MVFVNVAQASYLIAVVEPVHLVQLIEIDDLTELRVYNALLGI